MEFFTVGVYNSTEQEYFDKLTGYNIDTFCDIRQRRGVRGSKYAFVNSKRLQEKLAELEINYMHVLELAPTKEIRELQKSADVLKGTLKSKRAELGTIFVNAYRGEILAKFDLDEYVSTLEKAGAIRIVLFCVEEKPGACHRSIVTAKLSGIGYKVTHL